MDALRIALCDDVSTEKELLEQYIRQWADRQSLPVCVRSFSDGQSLLHAMEREAFPIVFLDIQMQGLDGMETARRIRQIDGSAKEAGICFVTGYEDYLAEGYEVEAFRYLLKPLKKEKLQERLIPFSGGCRKESRSGPSRPQTGKREWLFPKFFIWRPSAIPARFMATRKALP